MNALGIISSVAMGISAALWFYWGVWQAEQDERNEHE